MELNESNMAAFDRCVDDMVVNSSSISNNTCSNIQPIPLMHNGPDTIQYMMTTCPQHDFTNQKATPPQNTLMYYPTPGQTSSFQPSYNYFPTNIPGQDCNVAIQPPNAQFYMAPNTAYSQVPVQPNYYPGYANATPVLGYATTVPCNCSAVGCNGFQLAFVPTTPAAPNNNIDPQIMHSVPQPTQSKITPQRPSDYLSKSTGNLLSMSTPQARPLVALKSGEGSGRGDPDLRRRLFPQSSRSSPLSPPFNMDDLNLSSAWSRRRMGYYNNILYKTEICKDYVKSGRCPRGASCQFAHGSVEVHDPRSHPLYKTAFCHDFKETRKCPRGNQCFHVHHSSEMRKKPNRRPTSGQSSPKQQKEESISDSPEILISKVSLNEAPATETNKSVSDDDVLKYIKKKGIWNKIVMTNPGLSQSDVYLPSKVGDEAF